MVLLMLNLFAQAEEAKSDPEGATAVKVDESKTIKTVPDGDSYTVTMKGGPAGQKKTDTEGKEPDCEPSDVQRRCTSSPNKDNIALQQGAATPSAPNGKAPRESKAGKQNK